MSRCELFNSRMEPKCRVGDPTTRISEGHHSRSPKDGGGSQFRARICQIQESDFRVRGHCDWWPACHCGQMIADETQKRARVIKFAGIKTRAAMRETSRRICSMRVETRSTLYLESVLLDQGVIFVQGQSSQARSLRFGPGVRLKPAIAKTDLQRKATGGAPFWRISLSAPLGEADEFFAASGEAQIRPGGGSLSVATEEAAMCSNRSQIRPRTNSIQN